MSEETTTGVHRLYAMHKEGKLLWPRAAARLAASYDAIADILGPGMTKPLMLWFGVPLRIIRDLSRREA